MIKNQSSDTMLKGKLTNKNLWMFSLGTVGRDFLYAFFSGYLISYILFTKSLSGAQFASISVIIICARLFDAFNDPIMGGIVENTRTKWGKYKPWQLLGSLLTGGVVISIFCVNLQGWAFIGYLAFAYFLFSITFTMNDISYWGMMPTLSSNAHDRNKLTSLSSLAAGAGGGLVGLLVPILTAGNLALPGGAVTGYKVISICAAVLMIVFQLFTIFGVDEKKLAENFTKTKRLTVKEMFRTIIKNDQLLWTALVMLIFCIGTNVVGGGLSMTYIYFEFGYNGMLLTLFGIGFAVTSTLFTVVYPWLSKKFGRDKMIFSTGCAIIFGYIMMMLFAVIIPSGTPNGFSWYLKFITMMLANAVVGYGQGFYMIMVINIANTVEYNEWKTGKREEGLIFSLRPFTAKMGSALMQGLVMIVYLVVGVLNYTNAISDLENQQAMGQITDILKLEKINEIIASIPQGSKIALVICMCLIPVIFLIIALTIYKKKCFLNEETLAKMIKETEERKTTQETKPNNEPVLAVDTDGNQTASPQINEVLKE